MALAYIASEMPYKDVSGRLRKKQAVRVLTSIMSPHKNQMGISDGPQLPRSFAEACRIKKWAEAIDREYYAQIKQATWEYVPLTADMQPVPHK